MKINSNSKSNILSFGIMIFAYVCYAVFVHFLPKTDPLWLLWIIVATIISLSVMWLAHITFGKW